MPGLNTQENPKNCFFTGKKTLNVSDGFVSLNENCFLRDLVIKACSTNISPVDLLGCNQSEDGVFEFSAGESFKIKIDNLNKIRVKVRTDGDSVCWFGLKNE